MTVLKGDCLEVMPTLAADSFDSCVTDPPYHLVSIVKRFAKSPARNEKTLGVGPFGRTAKGFMGKTWDGGDIAMRPETWAEVLRVLKPGAHLVAFGGSRTFHRIWCAIEDAGFEVRDTLMWLYGSGFPKSHDAGDGWGTALKPAFEPVILARKPLIGTVAANMLVYGTGAINIDDSRVTTDEKLSGGVRPGSAQAGWERPFMSDPAALEKWAAQKKENQARSEALGRWPANVLHDGSDEVLAAFPEAPGQMADASTNADSRKTQNVYGDMKRGNGRDGEPSADSENGGAVGFKMKPGARRADAGSAARFFYCAKASKADRNEGTEKNSHPTVKPEALMRYLVRLVTPTGGTVLDPFTGSGSTGKAAVLEGFGFAGIEREDEYVPIAEARIAAAIRRRYDEVFG